MYIVIDKKTKEILWRNPAPKTQNLKDKEVWFEFNSNKHIVIVDPCENIEAGYFDIKDNCVKVWDLERKIKEDAIEDDRTIDKKYSDNTIDIIKYNNLKMQKLRMIRNVLLNNTIWIQQRHIGEKEAIEKGITKKKTSITEDQYLKWLLFWEYLRDIPETIIISDYSYLDITEELLKKNMPILI